MTPLEEHHPNLPPHDAPRWQVALLALATLSAAAPMTAAETLQVASPDGAVSVRLTLPEGGQQAGIRYAVAYRNQPVLADSAIAFTGSDGQALGSTLKNPTPGDITEHRGQWKPVYGERSTVENDYNEVVIQCQDGSTGLPLHFTFRCYDQGVAFKTRIDNRDGAVRIAAENTEFRFKGDPTVWWTQDAQGEYTRSSLSSMAGNVERPLVLQSQGGFYVAIAEARLVDYAPMMLRRAKGTPQGVVTRLGSSVQSLGSLETPWRVVMMAASPGKLLENNDLLLNLSDPCAIEDTSWIRPGKVLREITLTDQGARACVDFAAANGLDFIEFDAGWYGHEYDNASDATTITVDPQRSAGPLDLRDAIRYAESKGIGVIVYVNRRALERQLDDILPLYKRWGIAGVKYGFVNTGTQRWTTWLHEAVRKAADHRLMVDIHDRYRPTGYSRTYPNLMTQEGVRGDEATPSAEQALTTLFTRCLAGASDFTVCYFAKRVDDRWSHAHQLAKSVCFYSPWQFLYWYDTPLDGAGKQASIVPTPEQEFFKNVPTTWDETRVLHGEIGEYAVIARRRGQEWFIGAMNADVERTIQLTLDFLDPQRAYIASIYADDQSVDTPTRVSVTRRPVNRRSTLTITMRSNGGQAIHISPATETTVDVKE